MEPQTEAQQDDIMLNIRPLPLYYPGAILVP